MKKTGESMMWVIYRMTIHGKASGMNAVCEQGEAVKMGLSWKALSRGLALERGVNNVGPMAASAITALEALGVRAFDAVARFPVQATINDLEGADRIIALKHAEHLPL